ncbi:MAG: cytochrome oxidase subunit III, partial [Bacteroidetes bacterium]
LYTLLIIANIFLLLINIYVISVQKKLIKILSGIEEKEETSALDSITSSLTDAVPVEREEEILLDHEYDGIRELDNNLPPWWKYLFYLTIVFSVIYLMYYHVLGYGDLMIEEYQKEMAQAEKEKQEMMKLMANSIDETNVTLLTDEPSIKEGKDIFMTNCAACHGQKGEGVVGPNLTDSYWLHGGGIKNVFKTIKYGVPAKGMIAWETQLSPSQIQKVASYVLSLQGTNPPNGKAPEGEIWKEEAPAENQPVVPADSSETKTVGVDTTATAMVN